MEPGAQFNPEIKYFTKEKFPDLPDHLRLPMERAKNATDAMQAEKEKEYLPGTNSPAAEKPTCGDCLTELNPTYDKPQIRKDKAPMYPWFCNRHGTIYHPQRPPSRS